MKLLIASLIVAMTTMVTPVEATSYHGNAGWVRTGNNSYRSTPARHGAHHVRHHGFQAPVVVYRGLSTNRTVTQPNYYDRMRADYFRRNYGVQNYASPVYRPRQFQSPSPTYRTPVPKPLTIINPYFK